MQSSGARLAVTTAGEIGSLAGAGTGRSASNPERATRSSAAMVDRQARTRRTRVAAEPDSVGTEPSGERASDGARCLASSR